MTNVNWRRLLKMLRWYCTSRIQRGADGWQLLLRLLLFAVVIKRNYKSVYMDVLESGWNVMFWPTFPNKDGMIAFKWGHQHYWITGRF